MNIVLASASPRRRELLEMLGVKNLKILPAQGEERAPGGLAPEALVMELAARKAREVAARCGAEDLVIGADTIVWFEGRVFGKPRSREEAVEMLSRLSGNTHRVYTGLAVARGGAVETACECSDVTFRTLSGEEIRRYVDSGEPMDKAGAYGAQGRGALLVRRIEGDFFTVMGLPLCRLGEMLRQQGVEIL